jgi:hypothetical protein
VEGPRWRDCHRRGQARRARQHHVDLGGNAEAIIPKDKGIPATCCAQATVRGYLFDVRTEPRGSAAVHQPRGADS